MFLKTNTIIGHRGCRLWKPGKMKINWPEENSIEAFLRSIELGAEVIEMDVRRTRDGILVVFHDPKIEGLRIRGANWHEIEEISQKTGRYIVKFEDVLKALEGKTKLDVELKETGYEEEVVSMVLRYFEPANFIVKSFIDNSVKRVKNHFPTVTCGLLLGISKKDFMLNLDGFKFLLQKLTEMYPWSRVRNCQADFIAADWKLCRIGLFRSAKKRNIPLLVWTINTEKGLERFMKTYAVEGIITDRPDLAIKIRNNL